MCGTFVFIPADFCEKKIQHGLNKTMAREKSCNLYRRNFFNNTTFILQERRKRCHPDKRNKKQNMNSIYLFMPRRTYIIYYNIYLRKFKFKPLSSGEIFMYIYASENVIVPYNIMYIVYRRPLCLPPRLRAENEMIMNAYMLAKKRFLAERKYKHTIRKTERVLP